MIANFREPLLSNGDLPMTLFDTGYMLNKAKNGEWKTGLRDYFEYRDLELGDATKGAYHAQVIRARRARSGGTGHHKHDVDFQWVYVIKGWVSFDFKDVGHVKLEAGDCHYMPPGCHHELMAFSEDLELIEMYAPGEINSIDVPDFERRNGGDG
jgi:mannose-6-phosphate isomerase-like protein (cupin superfamily)